MLTKASKVTAKVERTRRCKGKLRGLAGSCGPFQSVVLGVGSVGASAEGGSSMDIIA